MKKIHTYINKKNLIIGSIIISVLLTLFLSFQLQKPTLLSSSSRAMELPVINIPQIRISPVSVAPINVPQVNIPVNIPAVNVNVPQVQIPQVQVPSAPSSLTSSIPSLGTYVSQGASIIQQIISNPDASKIIALFLGNILSGPGSSSSTSQSTNSGSDDTSPSVSEPTVVPTIAPKIKMQTCKEGDGTVINTCPARYPEGDKMVYRQCGATGWCSYTCFKGNTQEVTPCWDGLKQKIMTACNKLMCSCSDKQKGGEKNCPVLLSENGNETFRGCDVSKGGLVGENSIQWCNYTCFKPGTNEVADCWAGQNEWETPSASPSTIPGQNQPTQAPVASGKCHGKVPAVAMIGRPASEWELPNGKETPCTCVNSPVGTVCAKITCNDCKSGTCECEDMPLAMPPVNLKCSNGAKASNIKCQP